MIFLRIVLMVLIYAFCDPAISAVSAHWEFAGWHGGGCFPNVEFDPLVKDRVYLTSDVTGIWRSDDLGEHWSFITKGLGSMLVAQVAVAPSDSNVLYAATKGGLYVSRNAGQSWRGADNYKGNITYERPANYRSVAVDPSKPAHVCTGTQKGGVFCSVDYGEFWEALPLPQVAEFKKGLIPATAFTADGKSLIVAFPQMLARYDFKRASWQELGTFPKIEDFTVDAKTGTLYVAAGKKIWVKAEGQEEWATSSTLPNGIAHRIELAREGDNVRLYVGWVDNWNGWVSASDDEGKTWRDLGATLNADVANDPSRQWAQKKTRGTGLKVNPFNPKVVFHTDYWGAWRSDDGGETWNEKIVGAPNAVTTSVAVGANGDIYASSMDNGLMRSRDGGKTYETLFPTHGYAPDKNGHVWRVALAGDSIVATSSPWNQGINQVIVSDSGGKNFKQVKVGPPDRRPVKNTMWGQGYPRALAVDPNNSDNIYVGVDGDDAGGLFVSTDRGQSWRRSEGQPGALRVYNGLAVDPTDSKRIIWGAAANGGGVYVSEDGGKSFALREREMSWVFNVAVGGDGVMYAAGDSNGAKLYVSRDHGVRWKLSGDFDKGKALVGLAVDPSNPKRVAVGTVSWGNSAPCKIYMSNDGAKTWKDVTGDLPDGTGITTIAFDPAGKFLLLGRSGSSVYRMAL